MPPRRTMSLSEVLAVPSRFVSRFSVSQTASSLRTAKSASQFGDALSAAAQFVARRVRTPELKSRP